MYSPELLNHFENPRNAGEIENPDASVQLQNPVCGDVLKLSATFERGRIVDIRFLAKGCVPAMACGSAITELAKGQMVKAAGEIRASDLTRKVGGLPEASAHAGQLALEALAKLLSNARA